MPCVCRLATTGYVSSTRFGTVESSNALEPYSCGFRKTRSKGHSLRHTSLETHSRNANGILKGTVGGRGRRACARAARARTTCDPTELCACFVCAKLESLSKGNSSLPIWTQTSSQRAADAAPKFELARKVETRPTVRLVCVSKFFAQPFSRGLVGRCVLTFGSRLRAPRPATRSRRSAA